MNSKGKSILIKSLLGFGLLAGTVAAVQTKKEQPVATYAIEETFSYTDFYLYGYINNTNIMTLDPAYQFNSQGKLNVTFTATSYVRVRTSSDVYSFESYRQDGTPAPISKDWIETMLVNADQTVQFTLVKGQDGTLTLGYGEPQYAVTVEALEHGSISASYSANVDPETAYTVNGNKLTIGDTEIVATADSGYRFDCWKAGDAVVTANGTVTADTAFKAVFLPVKIKDILPEGFPTITFNMPENSWVSEKGSLLALIGNRFYLSNEDEGDYVYDETTDAILSLEDNNYVLLSADDTKTTFVMENDKLVKIIVENNPTASGLNGEYVKPLEDSNNTLMLDCGTGNMDFSVAAGVGVISMAIDNYEVAIELYFDSTSKTIPEGTYALSDTQEEDTALLSEGIANGAPKKSYILLRNDSGAIIDCWLLKEGVVVVTVSETSMTVEVTADNSNSKSIYVSGTYSFVRNVAVTSGENGSLAQAFNKDVLLDTVYSVNGNKITIGDTEVTAIADEGYKFDSWKIGDQVITSGGKISADTEFTATFAAINYFSVDAVAGDNGSVSLTEPLTIEEGTAYEVNGNVITVGDTEIVATADEGYEFDLWKIGDDVLTENGVVSSDITFTAEFKGLPTPETFVSAVAGEHGSVSLTEPLVVTVGSDYKVNGNKITVAGTEIVATAEEGYEFDCWKVAGEALTEGGVIEDETVFTAEFKAIPVAKVAVNAVAGEHGSVSLTKALDVEVGTAYTVNSNKIVVGETEIVATADEGYEFVCWKVSGEKVTENGTFTANTTFTAEFKAIEVPPVDPVDPVDPEPEQSGLSGGAIAGIAVGSVVGLSLIAYIVMFVVWEKKKVAPKFLVKSFESIAKLFNK